MISTQRYDTRVAGVVAGAGSLRPGIILGRVSTGSTRVPVALLGKVFCRADAPHAPIRTGDLLTTADAPGHAMRAPRRERRALGALLGKALAPLSTGQGLIPILVACSSGVRKRSPNLSKAVGRRNSMVSEVVRRFSESIDQETVPPDVRVTYRTVGGMATDVAEAALTLSGDGSAVAHSVTARGTTSTPGAPQEAVLDGDRTRDLFAKVRSAASTLVPRSEAAFLPDSVLGEVTIEVGGQAETFYFLLDEADRQVQQAPVAPEALEVASEFRSIVQQLDRD